MQGSQLNDALYDFLFYEIHDGIKMRALPFKQDQLMENAFVSFGYNMIAKQPLMQLRRWIPETSAPLGDEIIKFFGEMAGFYSYRWLMGKSAPLGNLMLKQLLSQGSQYIMKEI